MTQLTDAATLPIACSLDSSALARRADEVRHDLFGGTEERTVVPGGYAFRFPGDGDWPGRIAAFIASERTCCSFFRFEVRYEPGLGPIWLTLTGPDDTQAFIDATFGAPNPRS